MTLNTTERAYYEQLPYPLPRRDAEIDLPSIQARLREMWEQKAIVPEYLLLRSEDRKILRQQIGGVASFHTSTGEEIFPLSSQIHLINTTTDTRIEVEQEDELAPDTMMFLYHK